MFYILKHKWRVYSTFSIFFLAEYNRFPLCSGSWTAKDVGFCFRCRNYLSIVWQGEKSFNEIQGETLFLLLEGVVYWSAARQRGYRSQLTFRSSWARVLGHDCKWRTARWDFQPWWRNFQLSVQINPRSLWFSLLCCVIGPESRAPFLTNQIQNFN